MLYWNETVPSLIMIFGECQLMRITKLTFSLFQFYNLINIFQKRYVYMTPLELAEEIINGRRIKRQDDLTFFLNCDLDELCEGADRIRKHFVGDKVDLCSIINGRSRQMSRRL